MPSVSRAVCLVGCCGSERVLRVLQGDVDDGHQALAAAQGAQQPVSTGLVQHLQDVPFVEAQVAWFRGYVVTQRPHLTVDNRSRK